MPFYKRSLVLAFALITAIQLPAQTVQDKQMSIVFKKTATWCSNCGSWGWQWFKDVIEDTEGDAFPIALHSTSSQLKPPMDLDGALIAQFSGNGGFPTFFVNGSAQTSYANILNEVNGAGAQNPVAGIGMETGYANDMIQVQGRVEFFQPFQGQISIAYYLIRDSLVHSQAAQGANAIHRYVLLDVLEGLPFGTLQQVNMAPGESILIPAIQEFPDLEADQHYILGVIWSVDNGSYSFLNAWQEPLVAGAISGTSSPGPLQAVSVYPNPVVAGDAVQLVLPRGLQGETQLQLLDMGGRLILDQPAGGSTVIVDVPQSLPEGQYLLRIISGANQKTIPLQVSH